MSSVVSYGACLPGAQVRRSGHRLRGLQNSFATMTAIGALMLLPRPALGGPTGGTVVAGSAGIQQSGTTTNINQSSHSAVINWQGFSIGARETVNFNQPSAASATLNRVIGNETSVIDGALNANGQVFIVNSAGVLFGKGSQVNVGGLVASTLDISNANFMAGKYTFSGSSNASVANSGTIHASPGGYVSLLGKTVANDGVISANLGTVAMASGQQITLNFGGNSLVDVTIDKGALNALVSNKRAIIANGGQVIMTARAADEVLSAQVNNSGVIQARTMAALQGGGSGTRVAHKGKIKLTSQGGAVNVSGKLDASAPKGGDGGFIETSGDHVKLADSAVVTTKAASGTSGTWLIDPTDFNIIAGSGAQTASGIGATTLSNNLDSSNVVITTAASGTGKGDINVNAAVGWSANTNLTLNAANNVNVNAPITINGAGGGLVLNYGGWNGTTVTTAAAGTDYNIRTKASYAGSVLDANGSPVAKRDTSGGVYGSINFSNSANSNGLVINGQAYRLIHSMAELAAIDNVANTYALATSLDAGATVYNFSVVGTLPEGSVFAGLGHTIDNLKITGSAGTSNQVSGLFGTVKESTLRDLGLTNVDINVSLSLGNGGQSAYVGALAGNVLGNNAASIVSGVYSTGTITAALKDVNGNLITGTGFSAGGLIGNDSGNEFAGAINTVTNAFSTAKVSTDFGSNNAGGLLGYGYSVILDHTHATGNVDAGGGGGLAGYVTGNVLNSYATGTVHGGSNGSGGLLGGHSSFTTQAAAVSNSFATGDVFGAMVNGGLIGIGTYGDGDVVISNVYATGDVHANTQQSALGGGEGGLIGVVRDTGPNFTVINAHATGDVIIGPNYGLGGDAQISGVGGLIGRFEDLYGTGLIQNSYATGKVDSSLAAQAQATGGLVGSSIGLSIKGSYSTGAVIGKDGVGGLVGFFAEGFLGTSTIDTSYTTSTVTMTDPTPATGSFAGGLIGQLGGGSIGPSVFYNGGTAGGAGIGNAAFIGIGVDKSHALTADQLADAKFYANGTINQVLADRATAAAEAQAQGAQATSTANVTATDAQKSAVIPPTSTAAAAGAKAVDAMAPPAVEDNLKSIESNIKDEERRHHRRVETTMGTRHQGTGHRGGNFGATIRSIDVDGQRFNLGNGAPKPDTPGQPPH